MSRFQDGYKLLNVCQKYIDKHIWCYTYVYMFGFLIDNVFFEVAILNFSFLFEQPQLYVHVNQNCQILVLFKELVGVYHFDVERLHCCVVGFPQSYQNQSNSFGFRASHVTRNMPPPTVSTEA